MTEHPDKLDTGFIEYILSAYRASTKEHSGSGAQREEKKSENAQWHEPGLNHFISFIDEMPGGFFIYRAGGTEEIIYANRALLRIFNCHTMAEFRVLTGNSFRGIVHPDDLERVESSITTQVGDSRYDLDYVEYRIIPRGGGIRWLDDYGHFVRDTAFGDVFYVFVADATERKCHQIENENNRNLERKRYLDLVEGLSIGYESILYTDLDTDTVQAYRLNDRTGRQFEKALQTRSYSSFALDYVHMWVHPEERDFVAEATSPEHIRIALSGSKMFHMNYRVVKDGKTQYIQLRIVNVGESDNVSQIVMGYQNMDAEIIQEMEHQKLLEEALESARTAIVAKNAFLSNMSHDIRTPMNAVLGFTGLARKNIHDNAKVLHCLDRIESSGEQLLQLLSDVLEISRIESGKMHVDENECNLSVILGEVEAEAFPQADAKQITLSLDRSLLRHETVYSDEQKLKQILMRLVNNAVKYTGEGGHVSIKAEETGQGDSPVCQVYRFIVEDDGIGISANMLQQIFKPFERGKNTTLSGVHGTGLGLTITRSIVDMLDGTIDVVSEEGKCSRFTVTLCLRTKNVEQLTAAEKTEKGQKTYKPGKKRILVVEDTEINLEIITEVLKDAGYLVDSAVNGSIALEKVKDSKPGYYDLILMDIQMPVMDGYHATKAIRRLKNPALSSIPIVALSANAFDEDKRRSKESGMNAHMEKPIDTPQLMEVISDMMG